MITCKTFKNEETGDVGIYEYHNGSVYSFTKLNNIGELIFHINPHQRLNYLNGVLHGECFTIKPASLNKGMIKRVTNFVNGKKEGVEKIYVDDILLRTIDMKNSFTHGKKIDYFPNGSISKITNYTFGIKNGEMIEYRLDGSIYIKCNYQYDELYGEYIEYDENNVVIKQMTLGYNDNTPKFMQKRNVKY